MATVKVKWWKQYPRLLLWISVVSFHSDNWFRWRQSMSVDEVVRWCSNRM